MNKDIKNIVVLGGGFAGVAVVKQLLRHKNINYKITLIDKNSYHLFTPSLYEVATSEEPKKNITLPYSQIFGKRIIHIKGTVESVDKEKREVALTTGETFSYDFLVLSLGSEPAFYHIPGLKEHAAPLKTLENAIMIKNKIKELCCEEGKCDKKVKVVIGGGGFAGTELAAELLTYKNRLAKQHHLANDCLDISIIQGSDRLLKELDLRVSKIAEERLKKPFVHFCFGGHISKVTKDTIFTDDNKTYTYDILLWTGGVRANHVLESTALPHDSHGGLIVDNHLRVLGEKGIFAAGDNANFINPETGKGVPNVAQVAEEQGRVVGDNIYRSIIGKNLAVYHYRHFGYVVPLKGKFAVAELSWGIHLSGFVGWLIQQFVLLRYLLGILPLSLAFKKWNKFERELHQ